jgi:hypothetical protein
MCCKLFTNECAKKGSIAEYKHWVDACTLLLRKSSVAEYKHWVHAFTLRHYISWHIVGEQIAMHQQLLYSFLTYGVMWYFNMFLMPS